MSGKFNPAKSDYNKDETFSVFTIDETVKVTLSEAIAKDSGDNYITVYGFVELPLKGVEQMGKPMWVYEPTLCKFQIPKKDYSTEYQGKKKEYKQVPGMRAAIYLIEQIGYDKPFKGMFDFGVALPVVETIITGKNPDGGDPSSTEMAMIGQYFMNIEPIDELDKLKGIEIKDANGKGGYGRGGGGQKESERLKDKIEFIKAQLLPDSDLDVILASMYDTHLPARKVELIEHLLKSLFN